MYDTRAISRLHKLCYKLWSRKTSRRSWVTTEEPWVSRDNCPQKSYVMNRNSRVTSYKSCVTCRQLLVSSHSGSVTNSFVCSEIAFPFFSGFSPM